MDVDNIIRATGYFWLVVKGDSMIGDLIRDGDLALVRIQPDVKSGEMAAVVVDGEDGLIRWVCKNESSIVLRSSNSTYPPRVFCGENMDLVRIIGKVMEIKRKL